MPINGMIFDNRVPTAKAFRNGFQSTLSDGILSGCDITIPTPYTVTIGTGFIIVAGGIFKIDGAITVEMEDSFADYNYARIIATFDPSQTSTENTFEQISFSVDYANAISEFSALPHGNVNASISSGTYAAEVAIINHSNYTVYRKNMAGPNIKYVDSPATNVSITRNDGWVRFESPDGLPSGATVFSVTVRTWSTNNNPFSIIPYPPRAYITGVKDTEITGLVLRFWYF